MPQADAQVNALPQAKTEGSMSPLSQDRSGNLRTAQYMGVGVLQSVPAGTTNGTALSQPSGAVGIRFYLNSTDTVTLTFAASQPVSAPSTTFQISGANGPNWDENLTSGIGIYITATSGSPTYRWY